jgi:hypothetical protein
MLLSSISNTRISRAYIPVAFPSLEDLSFEIQFENLYLGFKAFLRSWLHQIRRSTSPKRELMP